MRQALTWAPTWFDSLVRLTAAEQKTVNQTVRDLQRHGKNPGMNLEKIAGASDTGMRSARASRTLRVIVHEAGARLCLCYVDHHDPAYLWAKRHRLETDPVAGAAQVIVVQEPAQGKTASGPIENKQHAPPAVLVTTHEQELLERFLAEVRRGTEDAVIKVAQHLPKEAGEALLDRATGVQPRTQEPAAGDARPIEQATAEPHLPVAGKREHAEPPPEQTEDYRAAMSRYMKERYASEPDLRARQKEGVRRAMADPAVRQKISDGLNKSPRARPMSDATKDQIRQTMLFKFGPLGPDIGKAYLAGAITKEAAIARVSAGRRDEARAWIDARENASTAALGNGSGRT